MYTQCIVWSFAQSLKKMSKLEDKSEPWPPLRLPQPLPKHFQDPRKLLMSGTFHAIIFSYLYKAVNDADVGNKALPYIVYLIEMAVEYHVAQRDGEGEI